MSVAGDDNPLTVSDIADDQTLRVWLVAQARAYGLSYVLAHADDGVIWGYVAGDELITSDSAFDEAPQLRFATLQQCRAFGARAEVLLWPSFNGWRARLVREGDDGTVEVVLWPETAAHPHAPVDTVGDLTGQPIDEEQILWGTGGEDHDSFTLLSDGKQGLRHAVPLTDIPFDGRRRPVRLHVRHYLASDDTGAARIALSRLVGLSGGQAPWQKGGGL